MKNSNTIKLIDVAIDQLKQQLVKYDVLTSPVAMSSIRMAIKDLKNAKLEIIQAVKAINNSKI